MKFRRERTPSHWLVQDIYLRDTWGSPFNVSRSRRWTRRRVFFAAMVLFGVVDVVLALILLFGNFLLPRPTNPAQRNPTRIATVFAFVPTSAPRPTRTPAPTKRPATPTRAPTNAPTQSKPTAVPTEPPPTQVLAPGRTLAVPLPASLNLAALTITIPPEPADCTPPDAMPDAIERSVKLCAGQSYRPFLLRGDNIGVFGDKSAVIHSEGRGFGIIAQGSHLFIQNVVIRGTTAPEDTNTFLCLYPDCSFRTNGASSPGGVNYGGGILVRASDTTIMGSDIAGGVAGIAADHVSNLKLIKNTLNDSTGWGSYNFAVEASYFVENTFSRDDRGCNTDSGYFATGCESSGWSCIACAHNVIAKNFCVDSGNCYYMNGEGNLNSNDNRFHQNECRAAPHNCFEVTFATGNEFVDNIARDDPDTGAACQYPFWVGGSQVVFAGNNWNCAKSPEVSLQEAIASTPVQTKIDNR